MRGRHGARLFGDPAGRQIDRVAGRHRLPACECAEAERGCGGVAVDDVNILAGPCRERRRRSAPASSCTPWPWAVAPVRDHDLAGWPDADRRTLEWTAAGSLDVIAQADARASGRHAARRHGAPENAGPAGGFQGAALALRIVAAVIGHHAAVALHHRNGVRHLFGRNEIAPADLVARQTRVRPPRGPASVPSRTCPAGVRRRVLGTRAPYS